MAIGQHTYWIVVSIPDAKAIAPPDDKRAAARLSSREAAQAWLIRQPWHDPNFEIVVEVPA